MIYFQWGHLYHSHFCSFTSICKHSCFTCILFKIICLILVSRFRISLHKKMKFFIKDFFSKCDRIRSFLRIWSHLLKKSLMQTFTFCAVFRLYMNNPKNKYCKVLIVLSGHTCVLHEVIWMSSSCFLQTKVSMKLYFKLLNWQTPTVSFLTY